MSAQEDSLLATRHQILAENYESLKEDYASLEQRFKLVEEMNAINLRLLKDGRERNEKDGNKKVVEDLEATIDELKVKNEELLVVLERQEDEQRKRESKYEELEKRFEEIEKECRDLKLLCCGGGAKKRDGEGKENVGLEGDEVVVVVRENDNVEKKNSTLADPIVLSDESDAESNKNTPLRVVVKQEEEGSNGVNSSHAKHSSVSSKRVKRRPSSSSSSSSSSSDVYLVPVKRSRDGEK